MKGVVGTGVVIPCPGYVPNAFDVTVKNDSTLSFWGGEWAQVEPMLFRVMNGQREYGQMYVAFQAGWTGRSVRMVNGRRVDAHVEQWKGSPHAETQSGRSRGSPAFSAYPRGR